jgi:hypothetical protein
LAKSFAIGWHVEECAKGWRRVGDAYRLEINRLELKKYRIKQEGSWRKSKLPFLQQFFQKHSDRLWGTSGHPDALRGTIFAPGKYKCSWQVQTLLIKTGGIRKFLNSG